VTIAERLVETRERIARAAIACGRRPEDVELVAVSKTKSAEAVREAYEAGQRAFGENYAQELVAKAEALGDASDIRWHFIGHLQTNKAKAIAKVAHVVHTVDSVGLARELGKRVGAEGRTESLPVLLEVNVSGESQKSGLEPSALREVLEAVRGQPSLRARGLMTVPPAADLAEARRAFEALAALRDAHGGAAELPDLSIGMSSDLEVAIACGATIVRVGTAIFGGRT
jgi:pyridoxal phosphate enzyme (YggS family)